MRRFLERWHRTKSVKPSEIPNRHHGMRIKFFHGFASIAMNAADAAVLLLDHGFPVQASPLVRDALEAACYAQWLAISGDLDGLLEKFKRASQKTTHHLTAAKFDIPETFRKSIAANAAIQQPNELRSAESLMDGLDSSQYLYALFVLLSTWSHSSAPALSGFIEGVCDEDGQPLYITALTKTSTIEPDFLWWALALSLSLVYVPYAQLFKNSQSAKLVGLIATDAKLPGWLTSDGSQPSNYPPSSRLNNCSAGFGGSRSR